MLVLLLGLAAMGAWQYREQLPLDPVYAALEPLLGERLAKPAPKPAPPPPEEPEVAPDGEAPPSSLAELRARVKKPGDTKLLPKVAAAREKGTEEGLFEAARLAERAASTDDPEALAVLAEVYAERRYAPAVQAEALQGAERLAPTALPTLRAKAAVAWAAGDLPKAAEAADACLAAFPAEKGCRWWAVRALPEAMPVDVRLAAWDQLGADWRSHRGIPREAALIAAGAGAADAISRLEAVRTKLPKDRAVLLALVSQYDARGEVDALGPLVDRLGDAAPPSAVLHAATYALEEGDPARVVALLDARVTGEMAAAVRREMRVTLAQARYELARAAPADGDRAQAAFTAAGEAVALASTDPAAAQARVLSALLVRDRATARAAWEAADRSAVSGRSLARLWLARAAQALDVGLPRDAAQAVEQARLADPKDPEVYLWGAEVAIAAQDPAGAFTTLRRAAREVDGTDARRARVGGMLPIPVDHAGLTAAVATALGADVSQGDLRTFTLAGLAWLGGDLDGALGHLAPLAERDPSGDVQGLLARLLLAKGDAAGAAAAADRALAVAPEPQWMLLRAQAAALAGDDAEATRRLATLRSSGAATSLSVSLQAEIAERAGARESARALAKEATRLDPTDRAAARLYGRLLP